jgi:RimJ/RimL family protein N-acetyltransferase
MNFNFSKEYVLENAFAKAEPLTLNHIAKLSEMATEPEIWTYFLGKSDGEGRFEEYVEEAIQQREVKKEYAFAIYDKVKQRYAGSTRFFDFQPELNVLRMGYTWFGKDFRGTGINKHCKYLLFEFAFETVGIERIGLGAHAENKVSLAAMESVGCTHEGTERHLFPSINSKGRADAERYGLLREEWENKVKNDLKLKL